MRTLSRTLIALLFVVGLIASAFAQKGEGEWEMQVDAISTFAKELEARGMTVGVYVDYGQSHGRMSEESLALAQAGKIEAVLTAYGVPFITTDRLALAAYGKFFRTGRWPRREEMPFNILPDYVIVYAMNGSRVMTREGGGVASGWIIPSEISGRKRSEKYSQGGTAYLRDIRNGKSQAITLDLRTDARERDLEVFARILTRGGLLGRNNRASYERSSENDILPMVEKLTSIHAAYVTKLFNADFLRQTLSGKAAVRFSNGTLADEKGFKASYRVAGVDPESLRGKKVLATFSRYGRNRVKREGRVTDVYDQEVVITFTESVDNLDPDPIEVSVAK